MNPILLRALFLLATLLGGRLALAAIPSAQQETPPNITVRSDQHTARGFGADSARVDSQITLRIPDAQADAVYQYLVDKYVGKEDILGDQFPGKHLRGQKNSDVSVFTDEYYDTPSLALYANKNSVRHRTRVNTTNPEDRKSGRQLVQVKVTPPGKFTLRNELKYEVGGGGSEPANQSGERHPLIRMISKKLRADFERVFAEAGLDARSLHHIFTIVQTRRRGYLNWDDKNILSFSVDQGSASILWGKGTFSSVDLGLVEIAYTEATEQRREAMWNVRDAILADLRRQFPDLVQTTDSKYSIVLDQLVDQVPALPLLLRTGLSPAESLGLGALGLVLALLVIVALVRMSKENPRRTLARPEHFLAGHRRVRETRSRGASS